MSDNWIVQNLENALETWNEKLAEIWQLITQSPEQFKGGTIWNVIVGIHGAVQAIGLALLVLFFVVGVMKTCGSFAELKRPEHALKVFIRFALAKAAVTYGLELMIALFNIVQGLAGVIVCAVLLPVLALIFLVCLVPTGMVSLGSITMAAAYPVLTLVYSLMRGLPTQDVVVCTVGAAIMGGMVIWMHRSNIQRIRDGKEYRFGQKHKNS